MELHSQGTHLFLFSTSRWAQSRGHSFLYNLLPSPKGWNLEQDLPLLLCGVWNMVALFPAGP